MGNPKQARPVTTYDHLAKKKPVQKVQYVPLDESAAERYDAAQEDVATARLIGRPERLEAAQEALEEAKRNLQENSIRIVHRAMGRVAYNHLISLFPPKPEDIEKAKAAEQEPPQWDGEALAPHLIAATVVEPKMTVEQVQALTYPEGETTDDGLPGLGWNESEYATLFNTALVVNNTSRISDFSF